MGHVSSTAAAKTDLRRTLRARRAERPEAERTAAATALAEQGGSLLRGLADGLPLLIAAYLSLPTEPRTDELIQQAQTDHDAIWVPKVVDEGLDWVALRRTTPLTEGPFGIREPMGTPVRSDDLVGLDVMFVPALAVDEQGRRLGQGGGYYDRLLANFPRNSKGGPLLVAVVFDDEVLDEIPTEEFDRPVDVALTPSGILDLG